MTPAPVIETERLRMRGPERHDWPGFCAFFTSERAALMTGVKTRTEAWEAFALEVGHWHIRGFGMWAVTAKGDDRCLGMVGCYYPETWIEKELGWFLFEGAEGRGIAFEAAQAARAHAYGPLAWTGAVSYIDPDNDRSIRLAERLGAVLDEGAAHPFDEPCLVFRHPAPEALA